MERSSCSARIRTASASSCTGSGRLMPCRMSRRSPPDILSAGIVRPRHRAGARVVLVGIEPDAFHSVIEGLILAARPKDGGRHLGVDALRARGCGPATRSTPSASSIGSCRRNTGSLWSFPPATTAAALGTEVTAIPPSVLAAGSLAQADVVRAVEGIESKSDDGSCRRKQPWTDSRRRAETGRRDSESRGRGRHVHG